MKTPPPLSPELEVLLAPHRTVLPISPSLEARAIARARAAARAELPERSVGWVPARPRWVFAAAAGMVLVLGAGAYAARAWIGVPPSPVTTGRERAPAVVLAAPPDSEAPATIAPPEAPRRRHIAGKANAVAVRAAVAVPTNAELELLRTARQEVTRGDFAPALATLAEHVRKFRHGRLVEEREALRVKSLAGLGRHEEARRAAAQFHARFPHSVFLSTFERIKETDR
jgi:hypothetical protein